MKSTKRSLIFGAALVIAVITLAACAQAQTFTTLASFSGGNGATPFYGSLIQATNGNYYGTTSAGGKYGNGVVFEVTPTGKLSDIYSFCAKTNCTDGSTPWSALVLGNDGNFYGTTRVGGTYSSGTVFKMTIGGKLTTLYSFCRTSCTDGQYPVGLVHASNGNFYGTASNGGANNGGTIFEISSSGKFKTLYSFCSRNNCTDGFYPLSAPMRDSNGNLYGTTNRGGTYDAGVVYEITLDGLFKTLYSFCAQTACLDGQGPFGGLTQDSNGNLYGTTQFSGAGGYGTIFQITPSGQLIALYSFDYTFGPISVVSAPIQASDGNLYGTTYEGGSYSGGTIYEITSAGVFSTLHSFCGASSCAGENPGYTLAQATNGNFIGTTTYGGKNKHGIVYSYATGLDAFVQTAPKAAKIGARVIILGNGLTGSTSVAFNGTAAAFKVISDTEVTATVPTEATTGKVAVTTPTGTLYSNAAFQVTK